MTTKCKGLTALLIKHLSMGRRSFKYCPKLRDVIYGRPFRQQHVPLVRRDVFADAARTRRTSGRSFLEGSVERGGPDVRGPHRELRRHPLLRLPRRVGLSLRR